jgi:hypothetical protein
MENFNLFEDGLNNDVETHWQNMPEYSNVVEPKPLITATFKFKTVEDYEAFHTLVKKYIYDGKKVFDGMQKIDAKQAWFPLKEKASKYNYV